MLIDKDKRNKALEIRVDDDEPTVVAERLNDFYVNLVEKTTEHLSYTSKSSKLCGNIPLNSFYFKSVTPEEEIKTITLLKNKTSSGPDQISTKILKQLPIDAIKL